MCVCLKDTGSSGALNLRGRHPLCVCKRYRICRNTELMGKASSVCVCKRYRICRNTALTGKASSVCVCKRYRIFRSTQVSGKCLCELEKKGN